MPSKSAKTWKATPSRTNGDGEQSHSTIYAQVFLLEMQHQVHRSRVLWPSTVTRLDETWKEHAAIVTALRTHDPAAAERGMREHLERARTSTVNRILPSSSGL